MHPINGDDSKTRDGHTLCDFLWRREASRKEKIEQSRARVAAAQRRKRERNIKKEEAIARDKEADLNSISTDAPVIGGLIATYVLTRLVMEILKN